ncbi:MAG: glycosyltransferase family A protein [Betaproteobacteria bacterium]
MSHLPLSVSLQTYNRGHNGYFRAALDAILAQTYADFELLVIDNHSTDETPDIVLSYKDPRLTYIRLPPGGTPADSIRRAFGSSRGQYLLTTHDDDVMDPTMIARQMDCVRAHPELACLATNVRLINEQGAIIQERLYEIKADRFFAAGKYIQTYFEEKFWLPTPSLLFKRDHHSKTIRSFVRETKAQYSPSGDIAGLFRLNTRASVGILAEPLLSYRQHSMQESRTVDQSGPLVALAKYAETLLAANRTNPDLKSLMPAIRAFSVRYQAQDSLFKLAGKSLERRLSALKNRWEKRVSAEDRGLDAILPFEVLLGEFNLGLSVPAATLKQLEQLPAKGRSQLAYRQWAQLIHHGASIFSGHPQLRRVAILGSMFTAFLLVLSARKAGIEVICCFDSSPARIGHEVFSVPIVPLEKIRNYHSRIDAVILSSERDHDEGLRNIIQKHSAAEQFMVHSWKDLAMTATTSDNINNVFRKAN